jgi:signal transduction histidine kinase
MTLFNKNRCEKNCFPSAAVFLLMIWSMQSWAQTDKVDSLRQKIAFTTGSEKLMAVLDICKERNSLSADSLLKYVLIADSLNSTIKDEGSVFEIAYYKTCYVQITGNVDSAIALCTNAIEALKNRKNYIDLKLRFKTYKAALFIRSDKIKEAIALDFEALKEAELAKDSISIFGAENSIGWANMEMSNFPEAIAWLKKSEEFSRPFPKYNIYPLSNLAACYNSIHKNDSALFYIDKALSLGIIVEDLKSLANGYAIKSGILLDLKDMAGAEKMMRLGIDIRKQIGDQFYVVSDMYQLGLFYASTHQCEKGIALCKEGIEIASHYNYASKLIILYEALGNNYKECHDLAAYSNVLNTLIVLKDSLYKKNSAEALAEMQTKYEVENKEKIIIKQEYDLVKRNYLIYGSMVLFALATVITVLVFKQYKNRQRNMAAIEVSHARENERKRIAAELHDNIGTQLSYISRKIEYMNADSSSLPEKHLNSLEDITSSARRSISDLRETIWALKKESISINDLADRIKVFVRQQLEGEHDLQLHIDERIEKPILFTSIESLNIFRILQEAIHNAIRHSQCRNLLLKFESSDNGYWRISVKDDGIGFDTGMHYENHFGLENMEERSRESGIPLIVSSVPGEGTAVTLSAAVKQEA